MAHVGVEGLGTRQAEHDGAQGKEGKYAVGRQKLNGVERVERGQNCRVMGDIPQAQRAYRDEPDEHDWAEEEANSTRAAAL